MQYERYKVPSLLDSTANGHIHALLPCYDLPQPLHHPHDLSKALHQRRDFFTSTLLGELSPSFH